MRDPTVIHNSFSGGFRGGAGGGDAPWLGKWPKVGPFGPFRVSNSDVMLQ